MEETYNYLPDEHKPIASSTCKPSQILPTSNFCCFILGRWGPADRIYAPFVSLDDDRAIETYVTLSGQASPDPNCLIILTRCEVSTFFRLPS